MPHSWLARAFVLTLSNVLVRRLGKTATRTCADQASAQNRFVKEAKNNVELLDLSVSKPYA